MYRRFASLMHPNEFGYAYDSGGDWSSNVHVCREFKMYQTYGDNLTQHSTAWPITREYFADYLASLAAYLVANPDEPNTGEETLTATLGYHFIDGPRDDGIEFCASVVYRESDKSWDKRRYYSVSERKIGGKAKEHDKRYQEIAEWNDGKPNAILRMILPDYSYDLKRYCYACKIKDWVGRQKNGWMPSVLEFLDWKEYYGRYDSPQQAKGEILETAFDLIVSVIERYRLADHIRRKMDQINRNLEDMKPKPATLQIESTESAA